MNLIDGVILLLSCLLIALGGSVIFSWLTHNLFLIQIMANHAPMHFNTAVGILLFGIAVLSVYKAPRVSEVIGCFLVLAGLLTLFEYLFGKNFGIDEFFIKSYIPNTLYPGRPAPNTAFCFLLSGSALLILTSSLNSAWKMQIGIALSLLVGGIGLVAFIGYISGIPTAYGWGNLTHMAVHTAAGMTMIGIVLSMRYWQSFHKGDLNKSNFLAILTFVCGVIFFIVLWQILVKKEHQEVELVINKETQFTKKSFTQTLGGYIVAMQRMQDRMLGPDADYPMQTWEKDVKNYFAAAPSILVFGIADLSANWVQKISRDNGNVTNSLNEEFKDCFKAIQNVKTQEKNSWFVPLSSPHMCVGFNITQNNKPALLFSIIDLSKILDEVRLSTMMNDYGIELYQNKQVVYRFNNAASLSLKNEWADTLAFDFQQIPFQLTMWPNEHLLKNYTNSAPSWSLFIGIVITFLFSSVIYLIGMMQAKQKSLLEEKQRTASIINKSREAFVAINQEGQIIDWNEQAEIVFGFTKDEILGKKIDKTIMPDRYRISHLRGMQRYLETGAGPVLNKRMELTALRKNGEEFPVEMSITPLKFDGATMFSAFMYDITDRKKIEKEKAILTAIMEFSDDAIVGLDLEGNVLNWNKGAEKLYGYTAEETLGKSITLIYPEGRKEDFTLISYKLQMGETVQSMEATRRHKDGTLLPVSLTASPIKNAKNDMIGISTSARDIRQQKELTEKLKAKNIELENASLAKDRFLASMSQELRTPLNAIIGFTGTLLMQLPGPLNNDQEKQLKTVQHSAKHLLSLINDILELAKIESGKIELNLEKVECNEIVKDVGLALQGLAKTKNIDFAVLIPQEKILVKSDKHSLTQILINLTNNAIKFTEKGRVSIELELKENHGNSVAIIHVKDTGLGIKKEDKEKLFKAFEQISTPGKLAEGTGLGLHLCKKLAHLIHAKINFESEFGRGSHFFVTIPVLQAVKKKEKDVLDAGF